MLKCFNQLQTNRLLTALESYIEVKLEARLEEATHLLRHFLVVCVFLERIQDEKVSDEVKKDKSTCACTKRDMKTVSLQLKTPTHWAFDVVRLIISVKGKDDLGNLFVVGWGIITVV